MAPKAVVYCDGVVNHGGQTDEARFNAQGAHADWPADREATARGDVRNGVRWRERLHPGEAAEMTYAEAFDLAVELNAGTRETVRVYKIDGMYWATTVPLSPYSSAILIGEVRRRTPR